MKEQDPRVLGRVLAIEEMNVVSGARTLPENDSILLPAIVSDTGTTADSGTLSDSGTTADSGTATDTSPNPLFARDAP